MEEQVRGHSVTGDARHAGVPGEDKNGSTSLEDQALPPAMIPNRATETATELGGKPWHTLAAHDNWLPHKPHQIVVYGIA